MKLLILSDLHNELWREQAPKIDPAISQPDVVILAGDIDTGARAVKWAAETFCGLPVLYVHGNHESYGKNLENVLEDIQGACQEHPNVHFLDSGEFFLGGVRFLGCCLWTDFKLFGDESRPAAMREAEATMTDYKRIRLASQKYRKLRSADTARLHAEQRSWLGRRLDEPFAGRTVVITHMAPSRQSVTAEYADDLVSAAYASNLDPLVDKADLWIHGHMHESLDYTIGTCRVVCNPRGYMKRGGQAENPNWNPNFVVEI